MEGLRVIGSLPEWATTPEQLTACDVVCLTGACIDGAGTYAQRHHPSRTAVPISELDVQNEHIAMAAGINGDGDGNGNGYGFGYGYGNGFGYGYGYGYGYGDGDGDGDGTSI